MHIDERQLREYLGDAVAMLNIVVEDWKAEDDPIKKAELYGEIQGIQSVLDVIGNVEQIGDILGYN